MASTNAQRLAEHFKTLEALFAADWLDLSSIVRMSKNTAQAVQDFIKQEGQRQRVLQLEQQLCFVSMVTVLNEFLIERKAIIFYSQTQLIDNHLLESFIECHLL